MLREIASAQPYWVSTTYAPRPDKAGFFAQVKKNLFLKKRLTRAKKFLLIKMRSVFLSRWSSTGYKKALR
jgi:hypothetical protein